MSSYQKTLFELQAKGGKGKAKGLNTCENSFNQSGQSMSRNLGCESTKDHLDKVTKGNSSRNVKTTTEKSDRFIFPLDSQQMEYAQAVMTSHYYTESNDNINDNVQVEYQNALANAIGKPPPPKMVTTTESINGSIVSQQHLESNMKILSIKTPNAGHMSSVNATSAIIPKSEGLSASDRHIRKQPEKVLDAPDVKNDFYLNILSWSDLNVLAVALNDSVYLWNATTLTIVHLLSCDENEVGNVVDDGNEAPYVSSLRWCQGGTADTASFLAVGFSSGKVQLWDSVEKVAVRTMSLSSPSDLVRVPCMAWLDHMLFTASRSGWIHVHDVRVARHEVRSWQAHTQEICGLEINSNSQYLASGGNDSLVHIWSLKDVLAGRGSAACTPKFSITEHTAAIKGLAWCPWRPTLLATGGGTADPNLRLYNVSQSSSSSSSANGDSNATTILNHVKEVKTEGQITGIVWNSTYREILTSHGNPGQLCLWKYPEMKKVTNLCNEDQEGRIISVSASPGCEHVASLSSEEVIQIWSCFKIDPMVKMMQENERREAKHKSTLHPNSFHPLR